MRATRPKPPSAFNGPSNCTLRPEPTFATGRPINSSDFLATGLPSSSTCSSRCSPSAWVIRAGAGSVTLHGDRKDAVSSAAQRLHYRRELDGLRGIAILGCGRSPFGPEPGAGRVPRRRRVLRPVGLPDYPHGMAARRSGKLSAGRPFFCAAFAACSRGGRGPTSPPWCWCCLRRQAYCRCTG